VKETSPITYIDVWPEMYSRYNVHTFQTSITYPVNKGAMFLYNITAEKSTGPKHYGKFG